MTDAPVIRSRFDRPASKGLDGGTKSRTRQTEGEVTNINALVKRLLNNGTVELPYNAPVYGDFTQSQTLQEAMNRVFEAQDMFQTLPASVRNAARNSPVELLAMLATEEGTEILIEAGLDGEIRRGDQAATSPDSGSAGEASPSADPAAPAPE